MLSNNTHPSTSQQPSSPTSGAHDTSFSVRDVSDHEFGFQNWGVTIVVERHGFLSDLHPTQDGVVWPFGDENCPHSGGRMEQISAIFSTATKMAFEQIQCNCGYCHVDGEPVDLLNEQPFAVPSPGATQGDNFCFSYFLHSDNDGIFEGKEACQTCGHGDGDTPDFHTLLHNRRGVQTGQNIAFALTRHWASFRPFERSRLILRISAHLPQMRQIWSFHGDKPQVEGFDYLVTAIKRPSPIQPPSEEQRNQETPSPASSLASTLPPESPSFENPLYAGT